MLAAAHAGRGQAAAVTAEPGVGKTRLVFELVQSLGIRDWRVLESTSLSYERTTSYLPIIELLRKYFELDEAGTSPETARRVAAKLRGLDAGLDEEVAPILSLLDALPEDDPFRALDARERRRRVLDALARVFLKEGDRQPLLLVFENLQWADAETRAVLDGLLERVPSSRLMLVLDYRPEFDHEWRRHPAFSELALAPLEPASVEELLQDLLGLDRSLAPLRRLLLERSQGNAFYLEEIVRTLAETHVLVGERGAYRLPSYLDQLAYHATRGEVWSKAAVYHRQVAARAVGRAANLEAVSAFEAALRAVGRLPPTRDMVERAIDIRLDLRAPLLQQGRLDEVLAVSREAERLARELGDEQRLARVYTYLVNHHYLKGETGSAIEYGERCLAVGLSTNDVALQALARQYIGQSWHALGAYARAERVLADNVEALDEARAGTSYVASCAWLAMSLADRGEFEAAYAAVERAHLAAEGTDHAYSQAIAWTIAGLVSIRRGYLARAVLPLERSFEACARKHLTVWQPIPSSLLGLAFIRLGHVPEGLKLLEEAVRLSRDLGVRAYLPSWLANLAEGYLTDGQQARARAAAQEALELATAGGERGQEAAALALLGDVAAREGAPAEEGRRHYAAALALSEELGLRPLLAETHLAAGRLCEALGDRPAAREHRTAGEALLHTLDMRSGRRASETEMAELGHLFIVARPNTDLYDFLSHELSGARRLKVILDRRQGERRDVARVSSEARRQAERRRAQLDEDLRNWGLAVTPIRA